MKKFIKDIIVKEKIKARKRKMPRKKGSIALKVTDIGKKDVSFLI